MKHYLIILLLLGFVACTNTENEKIEREGESTIYLVDAADKEMNQAIKTANQTLNEFNRALENPAPSYSGFALKTRFNTANGGEHIWISNILRIDNNYFGIVDNLPEFSEDVSIGDTIQIKKANISDWMYLDNQKLRGGYTIRIVRNRMTEQERIQFDAESGIIFED